MLIKGVNSLITRRQELRRFWQTMGKGGFPGGGPGGGGPGTLPPGFQPPQPTGIRGSIAYHHPPKPRSMVYPPIMDGLTFLSHMTRDFGMTPQFSAAGTTGLSTETVDGDGTYTEQYSDLIVGATANTARVGDGVLSEVASTNLVTQSEDLDNSNLASGAKDGVAYTANQIASPDGNSTADKLAEDSSTGYHYHYGGVAVTAVNHTFSIYAKKGAVRDWLFLYGDSFVTNAVAYFNLATGVVGTGSGSTYVSHAIKDIGSGWYRCSLTCLPTADTRNFGIGIVKTDNSFTTQYEGSTSAFHYLWGAQIEAQTKATSYIPTTSAAVTRAADNLKYPNTSNANLPTTFTLLCAVRFSGDVSNLRTLNVAVDAGGTNYVTVYLNNAGWVFQGVTGGAQQFFIQGSANSANTTYVFAFVCAANDARMYRNGVVDGTPDTGVTVPANLDNAWDIGYNSAAAGRNFNGSLKHLLIYDNALSAADIARITYWIQTLNGDL